MTLADVIARLRAAADGLIHVSLKAAKPVAEKAMAQALGINEAIRLLSDPERRTTPMSKNVFELNDETAQILIDRSEALARQIVGDFREQGDPATEMPEAMQVFMVARAIQQLIVDLVDHHGDKD